MAAFETQAPWLGDPNPAANPNQNLSLGGELATVGNDILCVVPTPFTINMCSFDNNANLIFY